MFYHENSRESCLIMTYLGILTSLKLGNASICSTLSSKSKLQKHDVEFVLLYDCKIQPQFIAKIEDRISKTLDKRSYLVRKKLLFLWFFEQATGSERINVHYPSYVIHNKEASLYSNRLGNRGAEWKERQSITRTFLSSMLSYRYQSFSYVVLILWQTFSCL